MTNLLTFNIYVLNNQTLNLNYYENSKYIFYHFVYNFSGNCL
jgi:hypothetical protein